jgi:hypothetical protein
MMRPPGSIWTIRVGVSAPRACVNGVRADRNQIFTRRREVAGGDFVERGGQVRREAASRTPFFDDQRTVPSGPSQAGSLGDIALAPPMIRPGKPRRINNRRRP